METAVIDIVQKSITTAIEAWMRDYMLQKYAATMTYPRPKLSNGPANLCW